MIRLRALLIMLLVVILSSMFSSCGDDEDGGYKHKVVVEVKPVDGKGTMVVIKYYRDSELMNAMDFIDSDGDGIIDGKAAQAGTGWWPEDWDWLDDLFEDIEIGESTVTVVDGRIYVNVSFGDYEFDEGEYEVD